MCASGLNNELDDVCILEMERAAGPRSNESITPPTYHLFIHSFFLVFYEARIWVRHRRVCACERGGEEELKKRTVVSDTTQDSRSGFHRQMRDTRPIKRRFQRGTDMCEPAARHRPSLARHRSPPVEN